MPIKYNITWADVLYNDIKKTSTKNLKDMSKEDMKIFRMAVVIASFSPAHSWRTSKLLSENVSDLKNPEVGEDFYNALSSGWKNVTSHDIKKLAENNDNFNRAFGTWLFYHVPIKEKPNYKSVCQELLKKFSGPCDDI